MTKFNKEINTKISVFMNGERGFELIKFLKKKKNQYLQNFSFEKIS